MLEQKLTLKEYLRFGFTTLDAVVAPRGVDCLVDIIAWPCVFGQEWGRVKNKWHIAFREVDRTAGSRTDNSNGLRQFLFLMKFIKCPKMPLGLFDSLHIVYCTTGWACKRKHLQIISKFDVTDVTFDQVFSKRWDAFVIFEDLIWDALLLSFCSILRLKVYCATSEPDILRGRSDALLLVIYALFSDDFLLEISDVKS